MPDSITDTQRLGDALDGLTMLNINHLAEHLALARDTLADLADGAQSDDRPDERT